MRKTVLLIDDDREEHDLFISVLSEYDGSTEVVSAFDGIEALRILKTVVPLYIFLDINMPRINGLEVLRELKKDDNTRNIPVYIFSTSDGYHSKPVAIKLGAEKYFSKPNSFEELKKIFTEAFF